MPQFLDLFLKELRQKREAFRRRLSGEAATELDGLLKTAFLNEWRELPQPTEQDLRVIAVDSGRSTREYASGTFMYICRACAYTSWGESHRRISSNAHLIASPRERLLELVSLRSEHIEHQVALEAIQDADDVDLVLIDGSLYGRITHVPISFVYSGEHDVYLRYMQTFIQLLEECRKRKILILGISKDSVARHLTRLLLVSVKANVLQQFDQLLSPQGLEQLIDFFEVEKKQSVSARRVLKGLSISKNQFSLIWDLLLELHRPRPDFALINAWAKKIKGYTTPVEPYPDMPLFKYESKNPADYVRRRFAIAYNEYETEEEFEKWAIPVMQDTFHLPTFVTFCAKLAHNDTPIRVDMPAFNVGLPTRISELSSSKMLNPPPERIIKVLQILQSQYGGPELYNAYLTRADKEARFPISDVKTLYEPLIEKELKMPLIPRRRERRIHHA